MLRAGRTRRAPSRTPARRWRYLTGRLWICVPHYQKPPALSRTFCAGWTHRRRRMPREGGGSCRPWSAGRKLACMAGHTGLARMARPSRAQPMAAHTGAGPLRGMVDVAWLVLPRHRPTIGPLRQGRSGGREARVEPQMRGRAGSLVDHRHEARGEPRVGVIGPVGSPHDAPALKRRAVDAGRPGEAVLRGDEIHCGIGT
jgi:hypothetical protein